MALELTSLRQAVADAIASVDGVIAYRNAPAQLPTGHGDQPVVVVLFPDDPYVEYHHSFGRAGSSSERGAVAVVHLLVRAYVPTVDWLSAQDTLDDMASAGEGQDRSVFNALMADVSLNGMVETLKVERAVSYRQDTEQAMISAEWALTLYVRR